MIVCPKCRSNRFFYVTRNYDYSSVDHVENGHVELLGVQDSEPDEYYENKFWCEDCGAEFSVKELSAIVAKTDVKKG